MSKNFSYFARQSIVNFLEALINIELFLPYFFSIPTLFKTLFSPWKNLVSKEKTVGFSFNVWFSSFSFNFISSCIGLMMRFSLIFFYFIFQSILVMLLPFLLITYIILLPILYIRSLSQKTEEELKELARVKFVGSHLLDQENYKTVATWFEEYYQKFIHKTRWWKKSNLFSIPPLARDWAVGFTPTLDQYSQDLTSSAYQNKTLTIVDREKEIDEMQRTLVKSQDASLVIVGDEGVGKHTIIVALAKKMYEGKTNNLLMYKRILWFNMEKILNQETDIQKREHFFEELLMEATEAKNIIILVDNIEQYIASDASKIDLTTSFEKYAKSNQIQFIGITTTFNYEKYVLRNERLSRLFTKIDVKEVPPEEAEKILLHLAFSFEIRYNIILPYETIKNAIQKSDFYITSIPFPEKAIDLLDSACILAKQENSSPDSDKNKSLIVHPHFVDSVLTEKTHIPTTLTENLKQKLVHLETLVLSQIVHQQKAIAKLSSALRRSFVLIGKRKKPLASLLFLGPTGVGKTQTAKAIAKIFFGGDAYLTRFDMSNYQSTVDIPQLIGSIDTGTVGLLAKAIRENPYGVLLLDEIEKGNKDLLNIFLTILDEGYFTDGFGKRVDCKNLVIIATSNAGSDFIFKKIQAREDRNLQTSILNLPSSSLINYLIEQKIFAPEFLNRFDAVIAYDPLDVESAKQIAKKMIQTISEDIYKLHKVNLKISDSFLSDTVNKGYDEKFGARNLERLIRDEVEDKIAKTILEGKVKEGETIQL
ncbi:hypothetical protein A3C98_01545 [Candidatus Roizmanbacteria bacterium RIFCSPHIGHO2_02_FULL_37_15]|uniref:AAA+ ATPase domain-containing protein n=1 Tax=Candidatus Roizmanbacteria bacterium RIFCSPLOWO2_01_FULL_37_16 TaxID=1802058 RepID=A0A1F7IQJ6_9BACT|nr:MAG: hypothetical protein A2859_00450 [Candidatus Roizmanbacteria bacterium RIFCSPHIGHO2_01_FULL_37_16b]OGK21157.1 MAG: hypothetical protein A3C98_01545 [Candidatus Roizmanbacteria bacterium RIFCSPHIGHO2_02_FULL_37_15]OGK32735.1 MAG: hypothetical protein A3F57_02050 [Candidatus Roizmanbacteria bacterium RIFCSPHIGHO2_12_FULL_36_11]OGK45635.1 MAG: hypothetical protein A3B40_00385 [Candidatus Roizmanbacteria bacterium RIFCSPLOWO2_01_FULL_37_16]OGK56631.1 MAG: hypothetical protein A3I50_01160 [C